MITLHDVYANSEAAQMVLWNLLIERESHQSISHRKMPLYAEHVDFIKSKPYEAWYLIERDGTFVGAVYLTRHDEIGIFLFRQHQNNGIGTEVLAWIREKHPRDRYLANIAPGNRRSQNFFEKEGFELIQYTYELRKR